MATYKHLWVSRRILQCHFHTIRYWLLYEKVSTIVRYRDVWKISPTFGPLWTPNCMHQKIHRENSEKKSYWTTGLPTDLLTRLILQVPFHFLGNKNTEGRIKVKRPQTAWIKKFIEQILRISHPPDISNDLLTRLVLQVPFHFVGEPKMLRSHKN